MCIHGNSLEVSTLFFPLLCCMSSSFSSSNSFHSAAYSLFKELSMTFSHLLNAYCLLLVILSCCLGFVMLASEWRHIKTPWSIRLYWYYMDKELEIYNASHRWETYGPRPRQWLNRENWNLGGRVGESKVSFLPQATCAVYLPAFLLLPHLSDPSTC